MFNAVTIKSQKQIRDLKPRGGDIMANVRYFPITLKGAYEILKGAKASGLPVTGSVINGHLFLRV